MGKFKRTKDLASTSWKVVKADRSLLRFPIQSFFVGLVIIAVTGAAIFAFFAPYLDDDDIPIFSFIGAGIVGLLGVLLLTWVTYLFSGGLIAAAHLRLTGGAGGYADGMAMARAQSGPLFKWGLMNLTVGLILGAVQEAGDWVGDLASALAGMAWQVVTWLALPVIVIEGKGPIEAVKTSATMLKSTWGERLIASAGFGLLVLAATLPFLLVTILGLFLFNGILFLGGFLLMILAFIAAQIFTSAMSGVFRAALYHYAKTGEDSTYFTQEELDSAFRPKV
jgi:hypothetical protein